MTRDDIIRMAREAGGYVAELPNGDAWLLDDAVVQRFAALVAAAERERIIDKNAPVIEQINGHIKALEEAVEAALKEKNA